GRRGGRARRRPRPSGASSGAAPRTCGGRAAWQWRCCATACCRTSEQDGRDGARWHFYAGVLLKAAAAGGGAAEELAGLAEEALRRAVSLGHAALRSSCLDLEALLWERGDLAGCREAQGRR
ncbi:unnamed protein product, partial [Prorocentrum cordatum]